MIRQVPELRFTSDISHWLVTCERLLDDPADDLSAFVERVDHIQARVGYDQGPQVPHPGAPEYAEHLAFHQRHWERIWRSQEQRGRQVTTLTPNSAPTATCTTCRSPTCRWPTCGSSTSGWRAASASTSTVSPAAEGS